MQKLLRARIFCISTMTVLMVALGAGLSHAQSWGVGAERGAAEVNVAPSGADAALERELRMRGARASAPQPPPFRNRFGGDPFAVPGSDPGPIGTSRSALASELSRIELKLASDSRRLAAVLGVRLGSGLHADPVRTLAPLLRGMERNRHPAGAAARSIETRAFDARIRQLRSLAEDLRRGQGRRHEIEGAHRRLRTLRHTAEVLDLLLHSVSRSPVLIKKRATTNVPTVSPTLEALAGTLSGTVTEDGTGTPIEDVEVDIFDTAGFFVGFGITDATGSYSVSGLPDGTYFARTFDFSGGNFINELYDDIPCVGFCDATLGTPIAVAAPGDTTGIDFALVEGGAIAGTVTEDGTGTPIANILVQAFNSSGSFINSVFTGTDGTYEVGGLLAGNHFVKTLDFSNTFIEELYDNLPCPGFCDVTLGTPVVVASTATGIDFALAEGGKISGTVSEDGTGTPIQDTIVDIFDSTGSFVGSGFTDAAGSYSAGGLPGGSYFARTFDLSGGNFINELYDDISCAGFCDVTLGTPIAVAAPGDTPGIDFALVEGGAIAGTVTEDGTGTPIANILVQAFNSSGAFVNSVFTGTDGTYEVGGLLAGNHFVRALDFSNTYIDELYDNLPCPGFCDVTLGTPVVVASTATGIDFALAEGGTISGTVTEDGTGTPIQDVIVNVFDSAGSFAGSGFTDAVGSYSAGGLPSGSYFARTFDLSGGSFIDELYDDISCAAFCDVTLGTPIAVTAPGDTTGIDFALAEGGAIAGTVTEDGTGTPIADILVQAFNSSGSFVNSVFTGTDGTYEVGGLMAGNHFVRAVDFSNFYIEELYDNIPCPGFCDVTLGTPVVVASTATGIDFALAEGGTISGTVSEDGTGTPIQDVIVNVFDSAGNFVASGFTDAAGGYTAGGLSNGSYFARTFDFSGGNFINELYDDIQCVGFCDVTSGTSIAVTAPGDTGGIDFALVAGGSISGTVSEDGTGAPIPNVFVDVFDSAGFFVLSGFTDVTGSYNVGGLPSGTYFARTFDFSGGNFINELYDDIPCPGFCDVTTGTPVVVAATLAGIDFALAEGGSITGTVSEDGTGTPIPNVFVEVFDAAGSFVSFGFTDAAGGYSAGGLPSGSYFARTFDISGGNFTNELYDDFPCFAGCDVTTGTPIPVVAPTTTSGIDFALLGPPLPPGPDVLLGSTGNVGGALIDIDPSTGAGTFRAPHGAFGPVTEIEMRIDGALFGSTGGGTSGIITIDLDTHTETLVGTHVFGAVNGLEFVGSTLYGTYIPSPGSPSELVMVDQATGALTFVGPTGLSNIGGLAYDPMGDVLYGTESSFPGGSRLVTLDTSTGLATPIGPVGFNDVAALEFGPDGTLFGGISGGGGDPNAGSLITIDPATGAGTLVGPTGFPRVSGLTFSHGLCSTGLDLFGQVVDTPMTFESTGVIRAGNGFTVASGGIASLVTATGTVFRQGFTIEAGGSLSVTVDLGLSCPP